MPDVPDEMKENGRPVDPVFLDDEELYRRIPPDCFEGESITIEALDLPDMSVNRQKYGPPGWLLLDSRYDGWGVLAFQVQHIPPELIYRGVDRYTFAVQHRPNRLNYPHSEVWAFCNENHVQVKGNFLLEPEIHQRWRQQLLWKCRPVIRPTA